MFAEVGCPRLRAKSRGSVRSGKGICFFPEKCRNDVVLGILILWSRERLKLKVQYTLLVVNFKFADETPGAARELS